MHADRLVIRSGVAKLSLVTLRQAVIRLNLRALSTGPVIAE
jgi:hypothetical protein